ncbi:MAG: ATP-binding cassette domain-containing protein [Bacilli bacterium]
MIIIDLINISKSYGKQIIFNLLNYQFEQGKTYLITGENGAGKTTIIKAILKLIQIEEGEIKVKTNKIGYVPEKISFPDFVRAFSFLQQLALIKGIDAFIVNDIVDFYLDDWCLLENKQKHLKELSKGMLQKILIIQSFLGNPDLLVFDEPLNGLDERSQAHFKRLITKEKTAKKTILISTHYPEYYKGMEDVHLIVNNGCLNEKYH